MSQVKNKEHDARDKRRKSKQDKTEFQGFFSVELAEDDVEELKELEAGKVSYDVLLAEFTEVGMKVSFIEQPGGSGAMCSVYAARAGTTDSGWGFSAWAATPASALLAAHYKFTYLIGDMTFLEYMDSNPANSGKGGFK